LETLVNVGSFIRSSIVFVDGAGVGVITIRQLQVGDVFDDDRRTRGVQRGPRSHRVVEKVRNATMAELTQVEVPRLTIEGIGEAEC
jgi:hypothetical protein